MNKTSFLFLLIIGAISLLGAYESLFPLPASTVFTRFFALSGYLLLCVSLIIGPLVALKPSEFGQLLEPRRAVGIACFVFVIAHVLLVFSNIYGWNVGIMLSVPSMPVAIIATIVLFILAATSADNAIRALGPLAWKNVQRLNYLAFLLSSIHFLTYETGLFVRVNGKTFVNLAEVSLLLLGVVTVILQIAGFVTRRKKEKEKRTAGVSENAPRPA
jgi:DMSO/TMAO reductase YedYZ heme-binding membrane subunit